MGTAYVYRLGDTGIYKIGKTKDIKKRQVTYETISTEPLILYAAIETTNEAEVETFMKHRLQSRRWVSGQGRELYEVEQTELDEVVASAREWNGDVLPRIAEAKTLARQRCDGRVLTPGDVEREMHRELMRLRQVELIAAQEQRRIEAELKIVMQTASQLQGIATWKNKTTTTFDATRLKRERRELYDNYTKISISRPFQVRW